jgi:hypothetical protein
MADKATIKKKMLKARQHIQAGEYEQARDILAKIDHPKAKEWLAKVNDKLLEDDPFRKQLKIKQKHKMRGWLWLALVIVAVVGALYALSEFADYQKYSKYRDMARLTLGSFCRVSVNMPDYRCTEWVNDVIDAKLENGYNVYWCEYFYLDPDGIYSSESFLDCLARDGIYLP